MPIIDFTDRGTWECLWYGYDPHESLEHTEFTWNKLHDPNSMVKGIMIFSEGNPVGFAHYILSENTLGPKLDCYIKDLFVAADQRSKGAGVAALEWFKAQAHENQWAKVTLKTRLENTNAQRLYDRTCERKSTYVHYDVLTLGQ